MRSKYVVLVPPERKFIETSTVYMQYIDTIRGGGEFLQHWRLDNKV